MLYVIYLNEMESHNNDVNINISKVRLSKRSEDIMNGAITCTFIGCIAYPCARCLLCSKYYCYSHLQECLQLHPNEIEVIRPL